MKIVELTYRVSGWMVVFVGPSSIWAPPSTTSIRPFHVLEEAFHFISFQLIWMTASTSNSHCRRKIELRMRAEWGSRSGRKHLANTLHEITGSDLPFDWLVGLTYWLVEWVWCCLKSTLCISYHTSLRMNRRENQNSLKRNRHLCKSDSRFISTGNGVNVADKKLIEIKSSPINHCVWSSFFYIGARARPSTLSFRHFTFNLFADIIFLVLSNVERCCETENDRERKKEKTLEL